MSGGLLGAREPSVGIVCLNWNGCADTLDCLRSLQRLDYGNVRTVVVDNGSTDDSVREIRRQFPALRLIALPENLGFSAGNNAGVRELLAERVEFIWLLNNDTVVTPLALRELIAVAQGDERTGVVGSCIRYFEEPRAIQICGGGFFHFWTATTSANLASEGRPLDWATGASMLVRSAVFSEVGLLDENIFFYWEDVEFSRRVRRAGWRITAAPRSVVYHRVSRSIGWRSPESDRLETESLTVFLITRFGAVGLIPLSVRLAGKVFKRVCRRSPRNVVGVARGAWVGLARAWKKPAIAGRHGDPRPPRP